MCVCVSVSLSFEGRWQVELLCVYVYIDVCVCVCCLFFRELLFYRLSTKHCSLVRICLSINFFLIYCTLIIVVSLYIYFEYTNLCCVREREFYVVLLFGWFGLHCIWKKRKIEEKKNVRPKCIRQWTIEEWFICCCFFWIWPKKNAHTIVYVFNLVFFKLQTTKLQRVTQ